MKLAVAIGYRGAGRAHEQRSGLVMGGPEPILPEAAATGVRLRPRRLPLSRGRVPVFDVRWGVAGERESEIKGRLVHRRP